MRTPLWVLLGFALWTLLILMAGVGVRRWSLILAGHARLTDFPGDVPHGTPAYRRAVRAHANCVETLPVYAAVAVVAYAAHTQAVAVDLVAVIFIVARVAQSLVHMVFAETDRTVAIRFAFFLVQILALVGIAAEIVRSVVT